MARSCERPGCSRAASVAFGFDAPRHLVILRAFDIEHADAVRSGVLCRQHADALTAPRGWWVDDQRLDAPTLFREGAIAKPTLEELNLERPKLLVRRRAVAKADDTDARENAPLTLFDVEPQHAADVVRAVIPGEPLVKVGTAAEQASGVPIAAALASSAPAGGASPASVAGIEAVDPDETRGIPWSPIFDQTDDLGGLLNASSPLLSRAFGRDRPPRRHLTPRTI